MKTSLPLLVLLSLDLGFCCADAQVLDHLRALAGSRYPVGDPAVTVTNVGGITDEGPKDVAVADLDADGHPDFAVSDKDGSITVYFGDGA